MSEYMKGYVVMSSIWQYQHIASSLPSITDQSNVSFDAYDDHSLRYL